MNINEIQPDMYFHDGKQGLRYVTAINNDDVTYELAWAVARNDWDAKQQKSVSILGQQFTIKLASFAAWAQTAYSPSEGEMLRDKLKAKSIKLSVGELAYMEDVLKEGGQLVAGSVVSFDHTEGRACAGLAKKGLVVRLKNEVEITPLGAAWLRA